MVETKLLYVWKNSTSQILRKLRMSKFMKLKKKWNEEVGAGFISDDIKQIGLCNDDEHLIFEFGWGTELMKIKDLNLRETKEAIKFLEGVQE